MRHDNEPVLTEECVIVALVKNLSGPEAVIRDILMQTINTIVDWLRRLEREVLKPDSKRSWSAGGTEDIIGKVVRRVFSKTIDERRLFLEILRLVKEFAKVRGESYSKARREG